MFVCFVLSAFVAVGVACLWLWAFVFLFSCVCSVLHGMHGLADPTSYLSNISAEVLGCHFAPYRAGRTPTLGLSRALVGHFHVMNVSPLAVQCFNKPSCDDCFLYLRIPTSYCVVVDVVCFCRLLHFVCDLFSLFLLLLMLFAV